MTPTPPSWPAASLRPWTDSVEDVASILAAFEADDMAGQAGEPVNSVSAARRWVEPWIDPDNKSAVAFSIEKDGAAVGHVMASSIDYRNETAWVSYWVTSCERGAGLASRATAALAGHCFGTLGLFRLELAYRVNNPGSAAVARNSGFQVEGLERSKLRYLDEHGMPVRFDVQTCARLRSDAAAPAEPLMIRV